MLESPAFSAFEMIDALVDVFRAYADGRLIDLESVDYEAATSAVKGLDIGLHVSFPPVVPLHPGLVPVIAQRIVDAALGIGGDR